jgi:hypothetical protein
MDARVAAARYRPVSGAKPSFPVEV